MMGEQDKEWRILHIDDDEEDYFITRQLLSQSKARKIRIEWASTFEDGCTRLAAYHEGDHDAYDAILVDYDLCGKSGIEIIRQFSAHYPAPLILYTGRGSHEVDLEAQQAGATMYITKLEATPLLLERIIRYAIELKHSDHALRRSQEVTQQKNEMLSLLNESAAELLAGADPISRLDEFLSRAGKALGLEVYVQYNLSEDGTYLNLGKLAGFPAPYIKVLSRLELGQAVCGTVAKIRKPIYVNDVQSQKDKMTRLIRKLGIGTYACHPLMVGDRLYGTLSFGSRSRSRFQPEEIEILKTFCNLVAEAIARKEAEEAVRKGIEQTQHILDSITDGFLELDRSWRFSYVNQRAANNVGFQPGDLLGKNMWEMFPALIGTDQEQLHRSVMEQRVPLHTQVYGALTDKWYDYHVYPSRSGIAVYWADVTERKKAEIALAESEEKFRTAFDHAAIGFAMRTPDGHFLDGNAAYAQLTGYSIEELKTFPFDNLIHPEDAIENKRLTDQMLEGQIHSFVTESRYVHKDGQIMWARKSASLVRNPQGAAQWIIALLEDITVRKRVEKDLLIHSKELERSNQALRDFAFIASHDLQEPLRKIKRFGELLDTQFCDDLGEQGKDYLNRMISAAARMSEMINGLLSYSRIASQQQPFVAVDLHTVAQEVLSDLDIRIKETQGKVDLGSLPIIQADPLQMHQLLQNLIGNALKYHRPEVQPRVTVFSQVTGKDQIQLVVQDNGIGFGMENAQRIFQPFIRLHAQSSYEGTGMGLAICQKIVERHGGSMCVESIPGSGSTFRVDLPIKH